MSKEVVRKMSDVWPKEKMSLWANDFDHEFRIHGHWARDRGGQGSHRNYMSCQQGNVHQEGEW